MRNYKFGGIQIFLHRGQHSANCYPFFIIFVQEPAYVYCRRIYLNIIEYLIAGQSEGRSQDPGYNMYTVDSRGQARSAHIRWSPDHHYPHTWPSSCYRSGHSPEPYFVSRGRSYRVKLGTRVTFHCEVSTLSDVSIRGHWYIIRCHSELVTDKLAAWSLVTLDAPGRMGDDMMRPQTTADCTMGNLERPGNRH